MNTKENNLNFITSYWYLFIYLFMLIFLTYKNINYINNDGLLYIAQTKIYLSDGYQKASELHNNNLFVLTAWTSKFLNLSVFHTYKIYNIVFSFLSYVFFTNILKKFLIQSDNKKLFYIAVILGMLYYPFFNNYFNYIIRDHAAWCFFFISLYFYLDKKFYKSIFLMLISSLFRFEFVCYIFIYIFFIIKNRVKFFENKRFIPVSFIIFILVSIILFLKNYDVIKSINMDIQDNLYIYPFIKYLRSFVTYNILSIVIFYLYSKKLIICNEFFYLLISVFMLAMINYYIQGTISYRYIFLSYPLFILYIFSIIGKYEK